MIIMSMGEACPGRGFAVSYVILRSGGNVPVELLGVHIISWAFVSGALDWCLT